MFHVTIKALGGTEKILYYPGDEKCCIYDAQLKLKVGECGQFEFKVPSVNVCYSDIAEWSIVTIYRDDAEYFRGFITEISDDFLGNVSVYCVEDLAWLNYSVYIPKSGTSTRAQIFQLIIDTYNAQAGITGTDKEFECGTIYYSAQSQISYEFTYDDTMLSILRQIAGDKLYVRVRRANGNRYIDLLRIQDFATENTQSVQFGYNLLDYTKEMNTSYMLNVINSYGAELETEVYEGCAERLKGTILTNETSIAKYGRIAKNVIFDGITDKDELDTQAQSYLNLNSQPRITLELNALDMSELGANTSKLDLGDNIWVIAEPYGIEQQIRVVELNVNIQDISKNTYTLSDNVSVGNTLTAQTIAAAEQAESIPSENEILKAAKRNAVSMLSGADGGYLNFTYENGQMTGFQITDSADPSTATKKWLWNENGLGYLYIDNDEESSTYGQWVTNNAMTADGQIVADMITTGKLKAIDIEGVNISGSTITGTTITSYANETEHKGKTSISGGSVHIIDDYDNYFKISSSKDASTSSGKYITIGSEKMSVACDGRFYEAPTESLGLIAKASWEDGLENWYTVGFMGSTPYKLKFDKGIAVDFKIGD